MREGLIYLVLIFLCVSFTAIYHVTSEVVFLVGILFQLPALAYDDAPIESRDPVDGMGAINDAPINASNYSGHYAISDAGADAVTNESLDTGDAGTIKGSRIGAHNLSAVEDFVNGCAIDIDEAREFPLPSITISSGKESRSFIYDSILILADRRPISGHLSCGSIDSGTQNADKAGGMAANAAGMQICIGPLDLEAAIERPGEMGINRSLKGICSPIRNREGKSSFLLPPRGSGSYMIFAGADSKEDTARSAFSREDKRILAAVPAIVCDEMEVTAPKNITAGEMLEVFITSTNRMKEHRTFGGILINESDYSTFSLVVRNSSTGGVAGAADIIISRGNRSAVIPARFDKQAVGSMISIIPEDCAIGVDESEGDSGHLVMLTDSGIKRGKYLLICAIYSKENGIVGLDYRPIEVS